MRRSKAGGLIEAPGQTQVSSEPFVPGVEQWGGALRQWRWQQPGHMGSVGGCQHCAPSLGEASGGHTTVGIWVEDMAIITTVWKAACGLAGQAELRPRRGEVELVGLTDGLDVDQRKPRRVQGDSGVVGLDS